MVAFNMILLTTIVGVSKILALVAAQLTGSNSNRREIMEYPVTEVVEYPVTNSAERL